MYPDFHTPVLTQLFLPKLLITFLTYIRGEERKIAGKNVCCDPVSNLQPPGHHLEKLNIDLAFELYSWLFDYFRLFIVATGCPSEQRPQKTVSCYGG